MKIGIITDCGRVARWQAAALRAVAKGNQFVAYDCTNSRSSRRPVAHGLYYLLNLFTVRNRQTATVELPSELALTDRVEFAAEPDGAWERLPPALLDRVDEDRPDALLKFGMGLLRVPPTESLRCPILSYHHGDPSEFRGRPAGFYELLGGRNTIGQVVQILSDQLDAGVVVAFAETRVHPHSWQKTLVDAFRASPLILPKAIAKALSGQTMPIERTGRNYRLPSNGTVLRFVGRLGAAKIRRLAYGALFEKAWQVATSHLPDAWAPESPQLPDDGWTSLPRPSRHRFLADAFFDPSGEGILAEAMRGDGRGEIVCVEGERVSPLPIAGGHSSYPSTFDAEGGRFLLPEISDWSPPRLFELAAGGVVDRGELDIPGCPRLLDPTLFAHGDAVYLFGNRIEEGDGVLRLWVADSLFAPFAEHPASPVRISPAGGRMAGLILAHGSALYRPGQDLRGRYGDGLLLFRIEELSSTAYREVECGSLRFRTHRGPHTLNVRGATALFDYYDDRFSLLAGLRRLRQSRVG